MQQIFRSFCNLALKYKYISMYYVWGMDDFQLCSNTIHCTSTPVHTHTHRHTHKHTHTHRHTNTHTDTHTHRHTQTHIHTHRHTHTYTHNTHTLWLTAGHTYTLPLCHIVFSLLCHRNTFLCQLHL